MDAALPYYFVPTRRAEQEPVRNPPVHALDVFDLHLPHGPLLEVVVGTDTAGRLSCGLGASARGQATPGLLRELHYHEMSCERPRRMLGFGRLFVLELELVEQLGGGDELNAPVCLYGALLGPLSEQAEPAVQRGQLTITRAELLAGFCHARPWAFRYRAQGAESARAYHALLPAGREPEVAQGRDIVLAYPVMPAEVAATDDSLDNASLVQLILGDVLNGLRADWERAQQRRDLWSRWFKGGWADGLRLDADADLDEHFALAEECLRRLPDWPSSRWQALLQREPSSVARSAPPLQPKPRAPRTPVQPTPVPAAPVRRARPALAEPAPSGPPAWMEDFLSAHAAGSSLTFVRAAARANRPAPRSDWREDFSPRPDESPEPSPSRPAWMDDFNEDK